MALNPADIAVVSRLLDQALALPVEEREAWLAALPAEHQRHLDTLRDMLAQEARPDSHARLEVMPKLGSDESVARQGDRVGPYRLKREVGRGGMGSVWLAERADGAYKRQVALKLPRLAWGAGLAERMARERDIGALLEHPHIARLYDAGVDERGRPYLALEYIDGEHIDAWCEARGLGVRERLKLFIQVARAVAYAHGRLVVHRDLKPSNVLVTPEGQIHLLDFGIAKLLDEAGAEEAGLTQQQGRVLTPHYASPEQVAGEPITVQSDVYSLGVLLYELLTGTLPIRPKRSSPGAVEDAILKGDAPAASGRVKDRAAARALRGEVDAILAKAMQRDPAKRYATGDALALDIERHLGGETVSARPDSPWYRLRKLAARNRVLVSGLVVVALALVGGGTVSLVQARRAADAADRERVVKEFVLEVFRVYAPAKGTQSELRQLPVELLLSRGAKLIQGRFAGQPRLQAELYGVVATLFADMGAFDEAVGYAGQQVNALAATDAEAEQQGRAMLLLARSLLANGRSRDAEQRAQRAQQLLRGNAELESEAEVLRASAQFELGDETQADHALDRVFGRLAGAGRGRSLAQGRAEALRARLLESSNRFEDAIAHHLAAIDIGRALEGEESPLAVDVQLNLAMAFAVRDRVAEAKQQQSRAVAALRTMGGSGQVRAAIQEIAFWSQLYFQLNVPYAVAMESMQRNRAALDSADMSIPPRILARADFNLGQAQLLWGNIVKTDELFARSIGLLRGDCESRARSDCYRSLEGWVDYMAGRHAQADRKLRANVEAAQTRGPDAGKDMPFGVYDYIHFARNLDMQGRYDEAEAALDLALPVQQLTGGAADPNLYNDAVVWARARVKVDRGQAAEALRLMSKFDMSASDHLVEDRRLLVGEAECKLGRRGSGLPMLRKSIDAWADKVYLHNPYLARARAVAAQCAFDDGDRALALRLATLAHQSFEAQPGVSMYFKAPLFQLDRALGLKLPPV